MAILKNMWVLWAPDINPTDDFIGILNVNYSTVAVIVDVSYSKSHKFLGVANNSKPDNNGSSFIL